MSDLTNRLSKAVFDYLDTANLRQEPFSLSRIEEVIAGVMATERKPVVGVDLAKPGADKTVYFGGRGGGKSWHQEMWDQMEANRKRQADFVERYKAQVQEPTAPVTYDLAEDPDAFKKARVGDVVTATQYFVVSQHLPDVFWKQMAGTWTSDLTNCVYRWVRIA